MAKKYGVGKSSVQRHLKHLDAGDTPTTEVAVVSNNKTTLDLKGEKGSAEISADTNLDEFFTSRGIDPSKVNITSQHISEWEVNSADGPRKLSSRKISFTLEKEEQKIDLPALIASAERLRTKLKVDRPSNGRVGTVVVWADPQTGKVDRLGGTEELVARIFQKKDKLRDYILRRPANSGHFVNLGDSVENIENTGAQLGTNDLTLIDQIDLEGTLEENMIGILASAYPEVTVSVVPSNHCQLRRGKNLIGRPGDDWGVFITRQIEKIYNANPAAYEHVNFNYPADKYSEALVIDVEGTKIGLAHGHQKSNPNTIPDWWASQVHGAILHEAEILLTGHFHHFLMRQTGTHIGTGRTKYHIQAPTLDNGSSWYTNLSGEQSEPGLLVFQVNENGLDIGSLELL